MQRMSRMESQERIEQLLNSATSEIISKEKARRDHYHKETVRKDVISKWRHAAHLALRWSRSHYKDHLRVTEKEHMSDVDCLDGNRMRSQKPQDDEIQDTTEDVSEEDLITIHPVVDGRFKDEGRN